MYTLFWSTRTAAFMPDAVLSLAGVAFDRHLVKRTNGRVDDTEFSKISPMQQIPALLMPDGSVLCESVAISLAVAERHPEAGVLPPAGTQDRALVYRWMMHMVCNIYEPDLRYSYSDRYTTDPNGQQGIKQASAERMDRSFDVVEAELKDGPWFLGDTMTVLDIHLAAYACWHFDTPSLLQRTPKIAGICTNIRKHAVVGPLFELYNMRDLDFLA
ncbi:MAG: glutathione S-transferase family protein [Rhodospirillales bacterium]|jgi:glutathione S-transferase|nr:glutathione S-transferase family protein [Rhodospirillales bacterium]